MKKHPFNIFPEASAEDFDRLLADIREHGFDSTQPITMFEGMVLDGWNRWRACEILNVPAKTVEFDGDKPEAVLFVMRTNKRRNLNKGQWATMAVEAEDLIAELREEAAKRMKAGKKVEDPRQKIAEGSASDANKTATKAAQLFNTNRTYVNQAAKVKAAAPEAFEKVKAGKMRLQDAVKEVARKPAAPDWLPDEIERRKQVERGKSVVANFQRDKHLIQWAAQIGKLVVIDRTSKWGNPFVLGPDGDRDQVCDCFEKHYAPHKESFANHGGELRGKVLVCHCFPERCHGNGLINIFDL